MLLAFGSYPFDGALRSQLEARMNKNLHGYSLQLGHAHAILFGLHLTLRDVVIRQRAHPEPPVARIPTLRLRLEWPALLTGHLVGDASFDRPLLHLDAAQLHEEELRRIRLGERGWQAALESIYPVKFNTFKVNEGSIVYVDRDPTRPLEITHWQLSATNIRNVQFADRVYPSPIRTQGDIFGQGRGVIDGQANFLSDPFPGVRALYRIQNVPLDRLEQFSSTYELHQGLLSSTGRVEYAPRVKRVEVTDVLLDGVRLDYVHAATTAAAERRHGQAMAAAAKAAEESSVVMRLDRLRLTGGSVGFMNQATDPPYRLFVDHADLEMLHVSNRAARLRQQPATAELRGRFMGSGRAKVKASFRPGEPNAELQGELAIENSSLPALNNLLLAYKKIDVAAGTFSVYSQLAVRNGQIQGYVKPMFDDVQVYDPRKDRGKPLGTKLKEKIIGGLAHLLENKKKDAVATRFELSGPVGSPRTSTSEIILGLLRNAFSNAIVPGFDNAAKPRGGH